MDEHQEPAYNPRLERCGFVLAIISILACFMLYLSIPFGCMAIIFTLLSRGAGKLRPRAKIAVIIASVTITVSSAMTGFYAWRITSDPQLKQKFEEALEYYTNYYYGSSEPSLPEGGEQT